MLTENHKVRKWPKDGRDDAYWGGGRAGDGAAALGFLNTGHEGETE